MLKYKIFLVLSVIFTSGLMYGTAFGENLNTKIYFNEYSSFLVEYPEGWNVDDSENPVDVGIFFSDGAEYTIANIGQWNTQVGIYFYPNIGNMLSETEEKRIQLEDEQRWCESLTLQQDGISCSNFKLIEQTSSVSPNGYPVITTVYTTTNNYPDYSYDFPMVNTASNIYFGDDMWVITSETDRDEFAKHEKLIVNFVNSFKYPATEDQALVLAMEKENNNEKNNSGSDSNGGGCLIATATFGSELAPQVQQLRELRDNTLLQTESGTIFMESFNQFYYSFSPVIADYERENPVFKEMVKVAITPMITSLSILNYVDMDSEESVLGYGISLIILNLGMYVAVPAIVIIRLKSR